MIKTTKTWEKEKTETIRQHKYFLKFLNENNREIKKFHEKIQKQYKNNTKNPKPPALNTLYKWSELNKWFQRAEDFDNHLLDIERKKLEKIGRKKRLKRLERFDERLGLINKLANEAYNNESLKVSSKAYCFAQLAIAERVAIESDRLDTDQVTNIINTNIEDKNKYSVFEKISQVEKYFKEK